MSAVLRDFWKSPEPWVLEAAGETKSGIDGVAVIGRAKGPMFVPNGVSLNDRFYKKSLWEKVLSGEDLKTRLKDKLMFGGIGHEARPVTDEDLRKGEVSHIVTGLWIDEKSGLGMGSVDILGTPAGKNLYIYLKAGSGLRTSSRASGETNPTEMVEGVPVVDEEKYALETFDFVLNPGFEVARPRLVEGLIKGAQEMAEQTLTQDAFNLLKESRETLQKELTEARVESGKIQEKLAQMSRQLTEAQVLAKRIAVFEGKAKMKLNEMLSFFESYPMTKEQLTLVKDYDNVLAALPIFWDLFKEQPIDQIPSVIKTMHEAFQAYKAIGTPAEINEALKKAKRVIEAYKKSGTPAEVQEAITKACRVIRGMQEARVKVERQKRVKTIAEKTGAPVETVKDLVEAGLPTTKIMNMLEGMQKGGSKQTTAIPAPKKPDQVRMNENRTTRLFRRAMHETRGQEVAQAEHEQ